MRRRFEGVFSKCEVGRCVRRRAVVGSSEVEVALEEVPWDARIGVLFERTYLCVGSAVQAATSSPDALRRTPLCQNGARGPEPDGHRFQFNS